MNSRAPIPAIPCVLFMTCGAIAGGRKVSDSGKTSEIRFGLARENRFGPKDNFIAGVDGACGAVPVNEHNTYPMTATTK
jgi:hypothetical protein